MNGRRILGRAVLVLCTAAIAAPAAQATFYSAGGTNGGRCAAPGDECGRGGGPVAQQDRRPVPQATVRHYSATGGGAGAAPPREPAEHGRGVAQQATSPVVIDRRPIVLESVGFDWADAGIGAAGAAGLVLIGGGAVLLTRHGRREQIATSE